MRNDQEAVGDPVIVSRSPQIGSLQAGRFLAALIVVLFHANLATSLPKYFGQEPLVLARSGYCGVEFFFVLSGFVIGLNHLDDLRFGGDLRAFAWKRFRRIYPALWVVLTGLLCLALLMPSGPKPSWDGMIGSYLLVPHLYPAFKEPLLVVIWSLRFEIMFYAFVALAIFSRKAGIVAGALLLLSSTVAIAYPHQANSIIFSPYPILFMIGLGSAALYGNGRRIPAIPLAALGLTLFVIAWTVGLSKQGGYISNPLVLAFGLASCMMVLAAADLERRFSIAFPPLLILLGDASFALYLVHYPVLSLGMKALTAANAHFPIPAAVAFLIVCCLAVVAGLIFHLTVERTLLRLIPARLRKSPNLRVRASA